MNMTVLSINGNKPMNFLLQTILSKSYEFIAVSDVFAGMNELKRRAEIDLILIDVDYSATENWDFIQHIKTSGLYQKPIIVLASHKSEKTAEEKGFDVVLKPFNPSDLVRIIEKTMFRTRTIN